MFGRLIAAAAFSALTLSASFSHASTPNLALSQVCNIWVSAVMGSIPGTSAEMIVDGTKLQYPDAKITVCNQSGAKYVVVELVEGDPESSYAQQVH